jgi:hypothetical protein
MIENGEIKILLSCRKFGKNILSMSGFVFAPIQGDLEDYELEEFFLNTMDKEFDTILEDQSEAQVARNLIGAYNLYKSQQYSVLESEIAKLKHQIAARPSATNESVKLETGETDEVGLLHFNFLRFVVRPR